MLSATVNLYVDRMSPEQPVRTADVYAVTVDHASAYTEAAAKIGLTAREYSEFRQALVDGGALYVRLPQRIDAMAGVHRRNGHVYALRNVVVPNGTMGWQVNLADGTTVLVPRICGNLSMNRPRAIAAIAHTAKPIARSPKKVRPVVYVAAPRPVVIPATPVSFDVPPVAPVAGVPLGAGGAGVARASALPFLGLLFPIIAASVHSGTTSTPEAPPCSGGSNIIGACRQ